MTIDLTRIEEIGRELLIAIGEDPDEERIKGTPARWAKWWGEFIDYDAGKVSTCFDSTSVDQMVVVSGMRVWSLCEHHLLPFWADVSIGYIPHGKLLGLSKFGRVAHAAASKLQLQERLAQDISNQITYITGSPDVAVLVQGEHLCMTMRGIRTPSIATSSVMTGVFRNEPQTRAEFMSLAQNQIKR